MQQQQRRRRRRQHQKIQAQCRVGIKERGTEGQRSLLLISETEKEAEQDSRTQRTWRAGGRAVQEALEPATPRTCVILAPATLTIVPRNRGVLLARNASN
jgi:hypothetical protein